MNAPADEPSTQRAQEHAAAELARRLQRWLPDSLLKSFAAAFIDFLITEGWRHIPPPPVNWRTPGGRPADPDTVRRQAEQIRRTLRRMPARGRDVR